MSALFKSKESKIFFTVWIVYILFISNYGGNWMEDSVLRLTMAIVDDQSVVIDRFVFKGIEDNAYFGGHYYSGFAPGDSFLAAPIYFVFKPIFTLLPHSFHGFPNVQLRLILLNVIATVFVASLLSALLAVLIYRLLGKFSDNESHKIFLTFTFSFATLFFVYSTSYSKDILKTFFMFASFYILFNLRDRHCQNREGWLFFFSGLFVAFSVAMDYKMVIVIPLFIIYLFYVSKKKESLYFFLGLAIPLFMLLLYDYVAFGNPFVTPYSYRNPAITNYYYTYGIMGMTYPNFERIYWLMLSPFRGFFFYMPIMILSCIGIFLKFFSKDKRYNIEMLFILFLFLLLFYYNTSLVTAWDAGGSFGPRYLIPVVPFMIIPVIFVFDKIKLWIVGLFSLASFFVNFLGVLYGREALWTVAQENKHIIFNTYIPFLFDRGLTNYTLNLIKFKIYDIPVYTINIIMLFLLFVLFLFLWWVWKK
ncbi:MAG: hypothetical protein QXR60_02635 [Candidatus Nanoarchaeia archaeon]